MVSDTRVDKKQLNREKKVLLYLPLLIKPTSFRSDAESNGGQLHDYLTHWQSSS